MMHSLRTKRGQSLVIIALSATALFGIIALGLDAGRLYFERRDVQNAADAAALAGAQELIPTGANPGQSPTMQRSARTQAALYAFKTFNDTPAGGDYTTSPTTVTAQQVPAQATITTPGRNNNPNEIIVQVTYNVPMTFASILGFQSQPVTAVAIAHGGFYNKTYTIFGFDSTGSGNSVNDDQNGWGQVDNGGNGSSDMCRVNPAQGKLVSNAKWHAPNPTSPGVNLNGTFYYAQASDTHAVVLYWFGQVSPTTSNIDPAPNYEPPAMPSYPGGPSAPVAGITHYHPGVYLGNAASINISSGTNIFDNGIYYFQDANFTITGGSVSNTLNGGHPYNAVGGWSDLPVDTHGTGMNGVEFVFSGNSSFSASGNANVFFVASSVVPQGVADSIAFFIKSSDTISGPSGIVWSETVNPGGFFQVWGTVFDQDNNGSHGTQVLITGVSTQLNPRPLYAVTGSLIAPQVDLDNGGLPGTTSTSYTPSSAPNWPAGPCGYRANPAGLLVQYNPNYAPHFKGLAYLVK
jgi:Flp pilus assembly protein TadG